ncbi:MAG: 50S ribosomal protein L25 [Candidatus Omnitrophica bacterium]|nr:50S ribosomal protein L25 [Candidatus Omnitrophota bacterium]
MDRIKIKVEKREVIGKEGVKKLRKQGYVPAVVYGEDINTVLTIDTVGLRILQDIHYSESVVIDMEIVGEKKTKSIPVLVKDVQFHPLTESLIHVDFLKVSLKEKIKVHIPIVLKGEAKQVKEENGTLEQILRELEVEGLPLDIPEKVEVDISELTIGHSLHVSNLVVPTGIAIVTDPGETVATALAKVEEVEEEAIIEEEGATEPEVIKEKKEADGEEPAKEEEKDKKE